MGEEKLEIRIKKNGEVEFTVHGVKGTKCEDIHKAMERMGKTIKHDNTSEMYEDNVNLVARVKH